MGQVLWLARPRRSDVCITDPVSDGADPIQTGATICESTHRPVG
jgi:hypothetical protein